MISTRRSREFKTQETFRNRNSPAEGPLMRLFRFPLHFTADNEFCFSKPQTSATLLSRYDSPIIIPSANYFRKGKTPAGKFTGIKPVTETAGVLFFHFSGASL